MAHARAPALEPAQRAKQLALFEGVGHVPPTELRIPAIRAFLDEHLGTR